MAYQEYLFFNLPWKISLPEAISKLPWGAQMTVERTIMPVKPKYLVYGPKGGQIAAELQDTYTNGGFGWSASLSTPVNIGGEKPYLINVYFASLTEENRVKYEQENTLLYAGTYSFASKTQRGRYSANKSMDDKLLEKLVMLYGSPDSTSSRFENGSTNRHQASQIEYRWTGFNDTEIVLSTFLEDSFDALLSSSVYSTHVSYVWHGAEALLQEADNATDPTTKFYKWMFCNAYGL